MVDTYGRKSTSSSPSRSPAATLALNICHGKKGTIHHAYWDGMEELGSLGLVVNAVVLWTIDAAVAGFRREGTNIRDEDVARVCLPNHKNWNVVLGRYSFTTSQPGDGLQPLRDPDAVGLDEDDEE